MSPLWDLMVQLNQFPIGSSCYKSVTPLEVLVLAPRHLHPTECTQGWLGRGLAAFMEIHLGFHGFVMG